MVTIPSVSDNGLSEPTTPSTAEDNLNLVSTEKIIVEKSIYGPFTFRAETERTLSNRAVRLVGDPSRFLQLEFNIDQYVLQSHHTQQLIKQLLITPYPHNNKE
jgi:hypothetical protein